MRCGSCGWRPVVEMKLVNKRRCKCARCGKGIEPGNGRGVEGYTWPHMKSYYCESCQDFLIKNAEQAEIDYEYFRLNTSGGSVFQTFEDVVDYRERERDFVETHGRAPTRKDEVAILQEMEKERIGKPERALFTNYTRHS